MAKTFVIRSSDIDRCPRRSFSATHYFIDEEGVVQCQCTLTIDTEEPTAP